MLNYPTTRNSIYCIPEFYLIEESSPTSSGNLEWVRGLLGGVNYDEINRMVAEIQPPGQRRDFCPSSLRQQCGAATAACSSACATPTPPGMAPGGV